MVKDAEAEIKLKPEIEKLLNDASLQQKLINNISPLGKPNAADDIANEVLKLAGVK
jgi:UDP-N-acetylglucosamine--N-acetylmuramyl-(pentapeptide) pyrophosphoryl-undecaprenol N-acetylglucosamine transferase